MALVSSISENAPAHATGRAEWQQYIADQTNSRRSRHLLRRPISVKLFSDSVHVRLQTVSSRMSQFQDLSQESGVKANIHAPVQVQIQSPEGPRELVLFSTNDYLGLSCHLEVRKAISDAAMRHGAGPRSSAIVSGHTCYHEQLERRLAKLSNQDTCLLCPTGVAGLP
jgi:7-keto-8-aminopelargonate synthetase-like enzyme